jgi:hypothetical protein
MLADRTLLFFFAARGRSLPRKPVVMINRFARVL